MVGVDALYSVEKLWILLEGLLAWLKRKNGRHGLGRAAAMMRLRQVLAYIRHIC